MLTLFNQEKKVLKEAAKAADKVIKKCQTLATLDDNQLKARTMELKEAVAKGYDKSQILVDAFANIREAAKRVLGLEAYKVQIMGAYIMHLGDVAEMRTGEGKTLTSIMTAYLNALDGKGVHIVTVNDYLCERDFTEMKPVFEFLGLTVGLNKRMYSKEMKRAAYAADITYTTNSELGFDYLRDNMVVKIEDKVQRGFNFSIVDECDSILIDESRTPLIISGGKKGDPKAVAAIQNFVKNLKEDKHFEIDIEKKTIVLTNSGSELAQLAFRIKSLYDVANAQLLHLINNSLRANFIMKKDVDYAVRGNEIVIIDTFTGRLMPGRSFSNGLHQAIQAKEKVQIKLESFVVATTTYQNFFRMYSKLAGMTGTAKTEEEEFLEIFNMRVLAIPTNKPIKRKDTKDKIFVTKSQMIEALKTEVFTRQQKGQPVLVGTTSVEASEVISREFLKADIQHEVLNAKNHTREASIIAKAGHKGSVTISTNMAGRGTDIKLGDGVVGLGGLCVLGIERNESRRIDNQLRGRAGRQGDPGVTTFYLSTEDDLIQRFQSSSIAKAVKMQGNGQPMESSLVGRVLTSAQKRLEGANFDQRKNLIKYDDVMRQQREVIYKQRDLILSGDGIRDITSEFITSSAVDLVANVTYTIEKEQKIDGKKLMLILNGRKLVPPHTFIPEDFDGKDPATVAAILGDKFLEIYLEKNSSIPDNILMNVEQRLAIQVFDKHWKDHIDKMTKLRGGVGLHSYKQEDPLQVYIKESKKMMEEMKKKITNEIAIALLTVQIRPKAPQPVATEQAPQPSH